MKKLLMASTTLLLFSVSIAIFQIVSCSKADATPIPEPCPEICVVDGTYSGTFTNHLNLSAPFFYILKTNNFTEGSGTVGDAPTAFGGFKNTCDSIKITTWNSVNDNYYSFDGKFTDNKTKITGSYKNLTTTSESGTFTLTKQ